MIVVDTSVLINFFLGIETTGAKQLQKIEESRTPFYIPEICCQELLQGAKNEKEWILLEEYLETQNRLQPKDSWKTYFSAARIYFDCRKKGITLSGSIDCFIAQLTLENNGVLLHEDADYEKISQVRELKQFKN